MKNPYQVFHVTLKALVISNNKLLLVSSSDKKRMDDYECPGGRIDQGEKLMSTLRRELKEEINLNLDDTSFKLELYAVNQRDARDYGLDNETNILEIYYKVNLLDPSFSWLIIQPKEHKGHLWIDQNTNLNNLFFRNASQKKIFSNIINELNT